RKSAYEMPSSQSERRLLWGGAFAVQLPSNCIDASELRQVPDNQEVYLHPRHDQSVMLELLEPLAGSDSVESAAREFFTDLADANGGSASSRIVECRLLSNEAWPLRQFAYLVGEQLVAKYNESARNLVQMHILLHRLAEHSCDLAVTLNHPISVCSESSSSSLLDPESAWQPDELISRIVESLELLDPTIFNA
ncbi:hypothetical protein BOX15_Mlig009382g1, partial [Macrostomum lignano]